MMHRYLAAMMVLTLCAGPAAAEVSTQEAVEKSKAMIGELAKNLQKKLLGTVKRAGFGAAISVCSESAPAMAAEVGEKYGAGIRRVSLKTRNPANAPDESERRILERMETDHAAGALKPGYMAVVSDAAGGRTLRFMKPIVTKPFCMNCHGAAGKLNSEAMERIEALYPDDRATGYTPNQVRGAFSVSYPLDQ